MCSFLCECLWDYYQYYRYPFIAHRMCVCCPIPRFSTEIKNPSVILVKQREQIMQGESYPVW